jgi:hypothetical protein
LFETSNAPLPDCLEPSRAEEHFKNKNGGEVKIDRTGRRYQANSASDQQAKNQLASDWNQGRADLQPGL